MPPRVASNPLGPALVGILVLALLAPCPPARGQYTVDYGRLQPGGPPRGAVPDLSRQLVAESRQLVPTVRAELAGTPLGRQVEIRGNALDGAVRSFDAAQRSRINDPAGLVRLLTNVRVADQQVEAALNATPGAAPQSGRIARRIGRLIHELEQALTGGAGLDPGPVPGRPGYDARRLVRQADRLVADVNALIYTIDTEVGRIHPYDAAARDLQGINGQLAGVRSLAATGQPLGTLQASWHPVRNRFWRVDRTLSGARPPGGTARALASVRAGFDRMTAALGLRPDYVIQPDLPAIIDPPTYDDFPYPIAPPIGMPNPFGVLTGLADQAIGEVDGFLLGIRPNIGTIPQGPQFRADGVSLRNDLLALRQQAASGAGAAIPGAFRRVESSYRRLADRTARVARGHVGPNIARVNTVGDLIGRMRPYAGTY